MKATGDDFQVGANIMMKMKMNVSDGDPADEELQAIEKGDRHTGAWQRGDEATLARCSAREMGLSSVSGAKKTRGLKP